MEFFHEPKIDWMGKKWYFIGLSIPLLVAGLVSIAWHRGLVYGIDFRGGTLVYGWTRKICMEQLSSGRARRATTR